MCCRLNLNSVQIVPYSPALKMRVPSTCNKFNLYSASLLVSGQTPWQHFKDYSKIIEMHVIILYLEIGKVGKSEQAFATLVDCQVTLVSLKSTKNLL